MSITSEISRIKFARNKIRNQLVAWGVAEATDNITALAYGLATLGESIKINKILSEGEIYNIPQGYHDGSGTVTAAMTHQVLDITHANQEQFKAGEGIKGAKNLVLPNIISIGEWAFRGAQELKVVDLGPDLAFMNYNAFLDCSNLTTLIFRGLCSNYGDSRYVLLQGTPIDNIVDGAYIYVPDQYLDTYKTLECWGLYKDRFKPLSELEGGGGSVEIDAIVCDLSVVGTPVFSGKIKVAISDGSEIEIKKGKLPNVTAIYNPVFGSESNIESLDVGSSATNFTLSAYAFAYNPNLKTLIFRGTINPSGAGYNRDLEDTPILAGDGYIYVPGELLTWYQTESGWAAIASQIKSISELEGE